MERLCVKWSEFETNIREYFRKLREEQIVFDVTLATDDGHQIQAHKIVLSAGSTFFRDIFSKSVHTKMLVYLKGIKSKSLKQVGQFLYNGEVYINQEDISEFLETAKELKIIGIESEVPDIIHTEPITELIKEDIIEYIGDDLNETRNAVVCTEIEIENQEKNMGKTYDSKGVRVNNSNSDKKISVDIIQNADGEFQNQEKKMGKTSDSKGVRERVNYSNSDKKIFMDIIQNADDGKLFRIVMFGTSSNNDKHRAWQRVSELFKTSTGMDVSSQQCRRLFMRMKA